MSDHLTIHWFRNDLRLADNPALTAAAGPGSVLPVYILDTVNAGSFAPGAASRWWLHHSLAALNASLDGKLVVFAGDPECILTGLVKEHNASCITWTRQYEPWSIARDTRIKAQLTAQGVGVESYNGSLLWEPWQVTKQDGSPYRVFTPFFHKGCRNAQAPRIPLGQPDLKLVEVQTKLSDLNLLPDHPWHRKLHQHWKVGEQNAQARMQAFLESGLDGYKDGRDIPARSNVSRLSASLHFGQISPNQIWWALDRHRDSENTDKFRSELGWREFSHYLLYHNPQMPDDELQPKFRNFPWVQSPDLFEAWKTGQTGIPLVDAAMRELWQTGYMHNRMRMVAGSFLVKNLGQDWRKGAAWFWDTLVDADLANNSAGWQWIAGCGADAAPYFRIFNPVSQGKKFDPDGAYVRRYLPELARLPSRYIHAPWEAPAFELKKAGITLGDTYPYPVVDLKRSRERALEIFRSL